MNYDLFTTQYYSLEVEIGRNLNRFTSKESYYNGVRIVKKKDMLLGNKIREFRDEQKLLQRQLAAALEIDTPMFSKIERGDRRAKREQVVKLAELLHQDENEMLKLWLADKVIDAVGNENDSALKRDAIKVAQKAIL